MKRIAVPFNIKGTIQIDCQDSSEAFESVQNMSYAELAKHADDVEYGEVETVADYRE